MPNQDAKSCAVCMLIPIILGVIGLSVLYWWTKESKAEYIENDLSYKSNTFLKESEVGGVIVNMDGRDATLTGTVESKQRSKEIENIIASLTGIRVVNNQLEIAKNEVAVSEPVVKELLESEPEIALAPEPEVEAIKSPQEKVVEEMLQTLDLAGITFLFGSDEITERGVNILNDVVRILNEHQEFDVVVAGHTDSVGDDNINLDLSQRRAQSVMNYLISQGIQAQRMNAVGYGESEPITSNDTQEGRAKNRRIEFAVIRRPQT